jgi:hypothetical protein
MRQWRRSLYIDPNSWWRTVSGFYLARLENYTFLTLGFTMQRTNVYGGFKELVATRFSNMPQNARPTALVRRCSKPCCQATYLAAGAILRGLFLHLTDLTDAMKVVW